MFAGGLKYGRLFVFTWFNFLWISIYGFLIYLLCMRKNAILFLIFPLVSAGLFFNLSGTVFAAEASIPHNGHACIGNGPKTCEWAFPSVGTYQAWGSDWEFKYKRYGSGGAEGSVRQDVCVSKDAVLGNNDDVNCWVTIDRGWGTLPSQYTTISQIQHIGPANVVDAQYVVLKVSLNHADTESSFTVEERQVSTDTLNTGQTNFATLENVPITWATDWATLGGWLEITGQGQPVYETLFGVTAEQSKNGTFPISFKRRGTKTINLYASGPRVDGSSPPGGPQDSGDGPPYEVFIPRVVNTAYAAGDGGTDVRTRNINILGGEVRVKSNLDNTTFGFSGAGTSFNDCPVMSVNAGQTWGCGLDINDDHDIPATQAGTNYTINPGSKTGYNVSVDDATQKVYDNQTTTFTISYTPIVQYGTVKVTSNVNDTDFGFMGGGGFGSCPTPWKANPGTWTCNTVEPGTHTINPENKTSEGYSDPPVVKNAAGQSGKETQTLSAGGTIEYNITYTAATGTISVTSNKNTNWNIDGPGSNDFSATNDNTQNYNNVPLGTYTISGVPATIIADSGKWFSLNPITPDTTQTLSSSGQTKTFTIDYTQTQPVCSPATQSVQAGSPASFTATGGDGVFSWSAPGSTNPTGTDGTFSTTYSDTSPPNPKTVTLTSNQGQTDTCSVTVTSVPACTADIQANGSDGPISIDYDTAANLTWSSVGASSCSVAPGGWTGTSSAGQSTGNLTSSQTYTLSCTGLGDPCSNAVTVNVGAAPSLSAGLFADPSTGSAPLSSVLTATVGGTATGNINYSFWWNCGDAGTSVAAVSGVCGALTAPTPGSCVETAGVGYKCDGISAASQNTVAHSYNSTSTGKVIVERDGAASTEARVSITISSPPPSASGVIVTPPNYCASGPAATVSWTYSDPLGSPQSAYRVQIDNNASFVSPEVESAKTTSTSTAYFSGTGVLQFGVNYNVRVMVWNSSDTPSAWSSTVGFSTPNYAYPQVGFSFSPTNPPISEPVQFTDATTFYAPGPTTWSWLFGDAGSSTLQNPTHTYITQGSYGATLTATDNAGQSCSLTKPVNIQQAIPVWKEVAPR